MLSTTFEHPVEHRPLRVSLILWSGSIGGAESFTVDLARTMQALGAEPAILFILEGAPLADRLDRFRVPHSSLGLPRGRAVLHAPGRFGKAVLNRSPDVAILVEPGYLAAALRRGGYRGPIIGIEHGSLLQLHTLSPLRRLIRTGDRISGARACSVVVTVSNYMRGRVNARWPRRRVVCIPNGIDLERFSPLEEGASSRSGDEIVIGCASRLIEGKGVEDLIQALASPSLRRARLHIAGVGPLQEALKGLARSLSVDIRTEFLGAVADMPGFWRSVDIAVVPSNQWVESFGMVAAEAMACGKPVVATDNGALPSIVVERETGRIVPAGDVVALATAVSQYAEDPRRRARDGANGRRRCEEHFGIERAASRYLELCADLVRNAVAKACV